MKSTPLKLAFILFFIINLRMVNAQITYVDLSISQPNVEDCVTEITTNFREENLKVFPNPTKGIFTVQMNELLLEENLIIVIHYINGQVIYKEKIHVSEKLLNMQINLSGYPSGTYLLKITAGKKYYNADIILK
jgi:uncharacterized protein YqgV (UPF0045/DUF77 family)